MTNASTIPTIPTPEATCDLNDKLDLQKLKVQSARSTHIVGRTMWQRIPEGSR